MEAAYIDYIDTHAFSGTLIRYLQRDKKLAGYYGNTPDWEGFAKQISEKKPLSNRNVLVRVLLSQYRQLMAQHPKVTENISLLARENTFTITTGHQLNIFTGPLYFIYKIATSIKLSQELKQRFPEFNFVPIYWMATEDHDFEEINHTTIGGKTITWDAPRKAGTGRMPTDSITEAVREYQNILGLSENSAQLADLVAQAYLDHATLADATRYLVNSLFSTYGLVIVDADHPELKKQFAPIIKKDILERNSYREITKTTSQLQNDGFGTQVHAREINFFYLTDQFRERIVQREDGQFEVLNQGISFSKEALVTEIDEHPERFSPNVVMRPLYEEVVLPNLAYIGGGAEIVYWLQLKSNFDHYGIAYPILVPRNSALLADEKSVHKIFRLDLSIQSLFQENHLLKNEYIRRHTKYDLTLDDEWMGFRSIFEKIKLRAHKIDPTLAPSAEAVMSRMQKAIKNLEKKLIKADAKNHQDALQQIDHLKAALFPGGKLQERTENFGLFYVKFGDVLIKELIRQFEPLDFKFTILY
ncbi:bacillithiol biosynthesis cysteine-adding enzyme BshC [bacterium A37T11]|nr:bacillithiol biosynthesis cysteine-adding enzyme BshC [bacterium A37T11]